VCRIAVVCAVIVLASSLPAQGQIPHEAPPVLSAKQLLPQDMLAGNLFTVDDRVPTDGYMGQFTLRSELGTLPVSSRDLLRIRIAELPAIKQLTEASKSDVFVNAMGAAAARPVQSVTNIVADPVGTAQGLPAGVTRFFGRVGAGAESIAKSATDSSKSSDQKTQETAERVGSATITALGFEQVRRQLAKELGVDPYTTNPVLAEKLTDMAWVAFSARLGVNALVSVAVPGSTAISLVSATSDLVYDTPTADLIVLNRQRLAAMGANDAQVQALAANKWFSLSVLTMLVTELERLGGVKGRPAIIALAATGANEQEARFLAASVQMLARLNVTGVPLKELLARRTVVGVGANGAVVVPAPVDYLSWTEQLARFAAQPDLKSARRTLWLTGRMSAAAQAGFSSLGWAVHEVSPPGATR
jgi:hypothetical protein